MKGETSWKDWNPTNVLLQRGRCIIVAMQNRKLGYHACHVIVIAQLFIAELLALYIQNYKFTEVCEIRTDNAIVWACIFLG